MSQDLTQLDNEALLALERQLRTSNPRDKANLSLLYRVKCERLKRGITSLPA